MNGYKSVNIGEKETEEPEDVKWQKEILEAGPK
jgi:hypothetical protein